MDRINTQLPMIRFVTMSALLLAIFAVSYSVWSRNDILEKYAIAAPATNHSK